MILVCFLFMGSLPKVGNRLLFLIEYASAAQPCGNDMLARAPSHSPIHARAGLTQEIHRVDDPPPDWEDTSRRPPREARKNSEIKVTGY